MFQPSKGHPQGVKLIHFSSRVNKTSYQMSYGCCITHYTLLTKLNFTSGESFYWLCCWNVSIAVLENGPLRGETCRRWYIVFINWCFNNIFVHSSVLIWCKTLVYWMLLLITCILLCTVLNPALHMSFQPCVKWLPCLSCSMPPHILLFSSLTSPAVC
jgi:hypothetical protein